MPDRPPDDRQAARSSNDLGEPDPFEVIDRRGRYILGAAEDYYGVWDTRGGDRYLERFPLTEEGFQAAERRFVELRRLSRRQGGVVPTALTIALGTGVGLWVLAGLAAVPAVFEPRAAVFWLNPELIFVVDALGFRMGVGAILVLAGWHLARRERATRGAEPSHPQGLQLPPAGYSDPGAAVRRSALDSVLVAVLVGGLAVWVLSAIAANLLFREPIPGPQLPFIALESARPHFVALFVQELAFRVWVAAGVLLLMRWVRPRRVPASGLDDRG
jgi:hypothetical protein